MSNGLSPQEIVNRAAEIMFAQADRYTPVLQAMQKAIGIIIDDDLLIVGFDPQDNPLSGHLNASINRNRVVAALREASGRDALDFRIIEGDSIDDWTRIKNAEARMRQAPTPVTPADEIDAEALADMLRQINEEKEAATPVVAVPPEEMARRANLARELHEKVGAIMLQKSDRVSPLLRAWAAATPITVDDDLLVVGFDSVSQHLAGHLQTAGNRSLILDSLAAAAGRKMHFRFIEGVTADEWERVQRMEAQVRRADQEDMQRRMSGEESEAIWERLGEAIHLRHQALRARQFPQVRVQFLLETLPMLLEAEAQALVTPGSTPEGTTRALARAIERVAVLTELPATFVALELLRLRGKSGLGDMTMADALGNLGVIYAHQGGMGKALESHRLAYEMAQRLNNPQAMANALGNMGSVYLAQGDLERALKSYEQAYEMVQRLGNP
jgi:tetratricopeptide (TPR) repeat protein